MNADMKTHGLKALLLAALPLMLSASTFAFAHETRDLPTAEQMFLKGQFGVKKSWRHPLNESHYGEDLVLSDKRPVVNLESTLFAEKYSRPGTRLLGNYYHAGKFYIVRLPDHAVHKVYFHLAYFPPGHNG